MLRWNSAQKTQSCANFAKRQRTKTIE
ncbi:hypothetical protein ANCCAN_22354 [Ancylostoma caninum]|uniref:Uncharacterized protein n=1 Tax=Ancylostoma caninum TaxID=29170 RepID=A0A368FM21_ANCCA|nr:hypothetical protein ANCCAN_22354 [Ancylostoma caninum]